jgi:hypothetical protein
MPERVLISAFRGTRHTKQGATSTSINRVRQVRAVAPHSGSASGTTVRREQTRATGYGCRRGENLRRVVRWRESCIAPTLSKDSHERSSGNPANPMSGDGMQQARTPFAEKTVEVGHVPQGRNEMAGRHACCRTSRQRWREGEWTQEGLSGGGAPDKHMGARSTRGGLTATSQDPLASWRVEGDNRTKLAKRLLTGSRGTPSGDLKPHSR